MPHTYPIFFSTTVISVQLVAALKVTRGRHLSRRITGYNWWCYIAVAREL